MGRLDNYICEGQISIFDALADKTRDRDGKLRVAPKWMRPERCENCQCWAIYPKDEQPPQGWGVMGWCTNHHYKVEKTSYCGNFDGRNSMINAIKYEEEIKGILDQGLDIAVSKGQVIPCMAANCQECDFNRVSCDIAKVKWLMEEERKCYEDLTDNEKNELARELADQVKRTREELRQVAAEFHIYDKDLHAKYAEFIGPLLNKLLKEETEHDNAGSIS